jgi:DNA-binding transcriptional ArsR family regulator
MSRPRRTHEKADVFRALADPTRRELLDALRSGPRTTGQLCDAHPEMTRFGVMSHLKVLVEAELVIPSLEGRTRWNHLNPVPVRRIYERWVRPIADAPAAELLGLERAVQRARREPARRRSIAGGASA